MTTHEKQQHKRSGNMKKMTLREEWQHEKKQHEKSDSVKRTM
jgi:hypothetical protein